MTAEHIIHTIWLVGQNYNEAPVFTSKSVQTSAGQGNTLKIWSGNETNLETDYKTKVAPSHLHEYCTCFMALDAVPHPPVGDWG